MSETPAGSTDGAGSVGSSGGAGSAGRGSLLAGTVGLLAEGLFTRAELGATEVQEEALRLVHLALAAISMVMLLGIGLLALLLSLAWWAGPAGGAAVLGVGAGVLLAAAAAAAAWVWRLVRAQRPLLEDTLSALRADARAFAGSR
jgi:uncharacterized membrane protein YqjE